MNKSESSLNKHLHDALLNISENDSSEAIDLLSNAGFNTSSLIKSSLDKVESYKRTLEQSVIALISYDPIEVLEELKGISTNGKRWCIKEFSLT